ncbi:dihydropteroate synthase [Marinoscillum sp.]|uniref:dihydropteroate synthase n=1 Tax=Marinoscillum sp. TaxID=2024838 RepID=UPI003BAA7434
MLTFVRDKSNTLTAQKSINIKGTLLDLTVPKVMGILNVTPDSFYEGSRQQTITDLLRSAEKMLNEGATFLDIGGYSTRPGADEIEEKEEINRILEPIRQVASRFPDAVISIDTFRSEVAIEAINAGAHIVNDISAGMLDGRMLESVGWMGVPYIAMHMRGTPQDMKHHTEYEDLLGEVTHFFSERISAAKSAGIKDVIIDPGFGFAKTVEQNFYLLNRVEYLKHLSHPLLIGVSRKSMVYKTLNIEAEAALNGTTVLNTVALLKGTSILRVHDVKEAVEAVKLVNQIVN